MNKKLRLVVTYDCPRNCEGCCNNDHPRPPEIGYNEVISSDYEEIYITGGEPLLYPDQLAHFLSHIKMDAPDKKIFIYSALTSTSMPWMKLIPFIDGITFTVHDEMGVMHFMFLDKIINTSFPSYAKELSLRLNSFVEGWRPNTYMNWQESLDKVWLKNCPIPEGEDFRILEGGFIG